MFRKYLSKHKNLTVKIDYTAPSQDLLLKNKVLLWSVSIMIACKSYYSPQLYDIIIYHLILTGLSILASAATIFSYVDTKKRQIIRRNLDVIFNRASEISEKEQEKEANLADFFRSIEMMDYKKMLLLCIYSGGIFTFITFLVILWMGKEKVVFDFVYTVIDLYLKRG